MFGSLLLLCNWAFDCLLDHKLAHVFKTFWWCKKFLYRHCLPKPLFQDFHCCYTFYHRRLNSDDNGGGIGGSGDFVSLRWSSQKIGSPLTQFLFIFWRNNGWILGEGISLNCGPGSDTSGARALDNPGLLYFLSMRGGGVGDLHRKVWKIEALKFMFQHLSKQLMNGKILGEGKGAWPLESPGIFSACGGRRGLRQKILKIGSRYNRV